MAILGAIIGIGGAVAGGLQGQAAADAQNKAIEKQYKYDLKAWQFNKKSNKLSWKHEMKQWEMNQRNEAQRAAHIDATNLQDWEYALKIQDYEYRAQMKQYEKSQQIYKQQLTYNNMAADAAKEAEYRKLQDATYEIAFQNQDLVIQAMQQEGTAATKGQVGRSADKNVQSVFASLGRNQAILAESLLSAKADTAAAMKKIAADKFGADIAAEAARMLKPERLPAPPKPLPTPQAEFLAPRKPTKWDNGPKPIKGAKADATGAWIGAASNAVSSVAGIFTGSNPGIGGNSMYAGNDFSFNFGINGK